MEIRLVRLTAITAIFCSILQFAGAQNAAYHQLRPQEFEGLPNDKSTDVVALIHCYIDFNYHVTSQKGIYTVTADVKLVFDHEKSWINRRKVFSPAMMQEILKHEQGHYVIAYMEQQELIRAVERTRFDANYEREANSLFDRIHEKYRRLTNTYDDETMHMLNRERQHSWDAYFKKRLAYMPPPEMASR
jgi:hypothetical protein